MPELHKDPVFDVVLGDEIDEVAGCPLCTQRIKDIHGEVRGCRASETWPHCQTTQIGFELDMGDVA